MNGKEDDDWSSNVVPIAPELNSPAYALVQGLMIHYRESTYIDKILEDPRSFTEGYNPLVTIRSGNWSHARLALLGG